MDFLKKHYEKVLLGVVLVGLTAGAAFLPIMIAGERAALRERMDRIIQRNPAPLPELDLVRPQALMARSGANITLDLSSTNKLFNSMQWKRDADGRLIKVVEGSYGPSAVTITRTQPLYTTLSFDSVSTTDTGSRYMIGVAREAAASIRDRRKRTYPGELNSKTDVFTIRSIKGPPDNPTELVLEMVDTGELVSLSNDKDKPFQRIDGYTADLRYEPEKKTWRDQRVGDRINVAGEEYNIVAITENEVVLSAKQNNKKTVITYSGAR